MTRGWARAPAPAPGRCGSPAPPAGGRRRAASGCDEAVSTVKVDGVEPAPQLPQVGLDAADLRREVVGHEQMGHRLTARIPEANTAPCSHGSERSAGGPIHRRTGVAELGDETGAPEHPDGPGLGHVDDHGVVGSWRPRTKVTRQSAQASVCRSSQSSQLIEIVPLASVPTSPSLGLVVSRCDQGDRRVYHPAVSGSLRTSTARPWPHQRHCTSTTSSDITSSSSTDSVPPTL